MADISLVDLMKDSSARKWRGETRAERFYSKCRPHPSGCLIHDGWIDKDGYPMVSLKLTGKHYGRRSSHVALALVGVEVPAGAQVNHHCDNRQCVNTEHLFIGSQGDNVRDMVAKGRHAFGEQHTISKLTDDAVMDIRENCRQRGEPKMFAKKYNVSISAIYAVRCAQNWSHMNA